VKLRDLPAWRPSPGAFAAGVGPLASLLLHLPLLLPGRSAGFRDLSSTHEPLRTLVAGSWLAGEVPHWNPFPDGGAPLLANPNAGALHPSLLTSFLFSPALALTLAIVLQQALSALAVFGLARRRGCGPAAAAVASVAWAGAGPILSLGTVLNQLNGFAWAPVAAWLVGAAWRRGGFRSLGAALAWGAVLVSGAPLAAGLALCLVLVDLLPTPGGPGERPGARRGRLRLAAALGGGALLAAPGLLPMASLLGRAERAAGFPPGMADLWSLHPARLLELLLPSPLGNPAYLRPPDWFGAQTYDAGLPLVVSAYVGAPVLVLAAAALPDLRRDRAVPVLAALVGVCLLAALGRHAPFHEWLVALPGVPPLRYPSKFLVPAAAGMALLAGLGYRRLAALPPERLRVGLWLGGALLTGGALVAVLVMPVGGETITGIARELTGLRGRSLSFAAALLEAKALTGLGLLTLSLGAPALTRRSRGAGGGLLAATLAVSMLLGSWGLSGHRLELLPNPSVSVRVFSGPFPPYLEVLERGGVPEGRIYRPRGVPEGHLPAPSGLREEVSRRSRMILRHHAAGLEGRGTLLELQPDRMGLFTSAALRGVARGAPPDERVRLVRRLGGAVVESYGSAGMPGLPWEASLAGIAEPDLQVRRVPDPLPAARVVGSIVQVRDDGAALELLRSGRSDPLGEAVVVGEIEGRAGEPGPAGRAELRREGLSGLRVSVEAEREGWLVLTESWDRGWSARVNGDPVPLLRADLALRALPVPPGSSEVSLYYRSPGWTPGLILALLALGALLILGLRDQEARA
jgi:hypothetical protein